VSETTPVPPELEPLVVLAQEWATVPDDIDEAKLDASSPEELAAFVAKFDEVGEGLLVPYLLGPASQDPEPSKEFTQLSWLNITLAEARFRVMFPD
jgi:hypothetical protein